jgi:hypothetical protein
MYAPAMNLTFSFPSVIAVVSLLLSLTVAYMTLLRKGNLHMTVPVQISFQSANGRRPEVILKTFLYATGKRGYVIESLYLEVQRGARSHLFSSWSYRQNGQLTPASGLRVDDDGVISDNHFFETDKRERFYFEQGKYEIRVYARVANRHAARVLHTVQLGVSDEQASQMHIRNSAMVYTFDPQKMEYVSSLIEQGPSPL